MYDDDQHVCLRNASKLTLTSSVDCLKNDLNNIRVCVLDNNDPRRAFLQQGEDTVNKTPINGQTGGELHLDSPGEGLTEPIIPAA